jgi:zinc protease
MPIQQLTNYVDGNNRAKCRAPYRAFSWDLWVRMLTRIPTPSYRLAACLLAALLSSCSLSTGSAFAQTTLTSAPPASFTLSNGLQVVVIPDHRTPVVTEMIWYKVGSADEAPGKSGLAHFLEHLMFKGTEKHPIGEFSKTVFRVGGNENAFTSLDYTSYFQRVPREQLPTVMEFEADRMNGLILKDENVLPERDVVLEEYNMRVANSPNERLSEQIMTALYLNHPYGRPVIGWHQEIEKLGREDALAFYRRFYSPNNAIVVIAGDVDLPEVRSLVERNFGPIPTQPAIPAQRVRPQEPEPEAPRTVTLSDPRVEQPVLHRFYLVPSATTVAPGESGALAVLAHLMGSGSNSYLYRALVVDKPLAVSASAGYSSISLDPTQFSVSASPKTGVGFAEVEQMIDGVIAGIVQNPIPAEDLERVKTQLIAGAIYAQDNQEALAHWYGGALSTGLSIKEIRSWPDRIRGVTDEQVRAAAQKWLDKKRSVTGYLIKDTTTAKTTTKREEKRS